MNVDTTTAHQKELAIAVRAFASTETGVTAIEYALLASLIAVGILAGIMMLRGTLQALWDRVAGCVADPPSCAK